MIKVLKMFRMREYAEVIFLLDLCFIVLQTESQYHQLKYINAGTNPPPNSAPQFNSMQGEDVLSNTKNKFAKAERLCVEGMWALYNTTDYGQGVEDFTTVISVRGTDIKTCTNPGQIPVLRNVQSVRYLGAQIYTQDGIQIFSQPYLLGGTWNVTASGGRLPTGITGFPLGSLAITGTGAWIICSDRDNPCSNGVCLDMTHYGNLYLNRNTIRDKDKNLPNGWPKTVRQVVPVTTPQDCLNYPKPTPPNSKRLRRHASGNIDIQFSH